ncbi:hypothetical protein SRB5_21180 [Streptomyces sp. RB5]|uniref:WGR domain-containing protein n=1 Tax=Streptomyces smaragdinus TaxID=2585196 RepID=A0A7K0CEU2_9ACTN|nr:DUF4132 domain-containing protein [Streptomyces smaragdinus]MQY11990.1 hypothetical protein [Streptomyces smaragdinus]
MRRWELVDGDSAKFWEAVAEDATVTVRYGRVGTQGRTQAKELGSAQAAAAHLAKLVGEKERKGYVEVSAEPAASAEDGPGVFALPDEDTFVMPVAWARQVYPRRGGIRRAVSKPDPGTDELVRAETAAQAEWIERMLSAPESDPETVEATRAHLAGDPRPLGAAVVACLAGNYQLPDGLFVDFWVAAHGLPFAARAVVESFSVQAHYQSSGTHRSDLRLVRDPRVGNASSGWQFADRMRSLLSVADEETYGQVVAVLAEYRDTAARRMVVSFLVPDQRAWVDDCLPDVDVAGGTLQYMMLCSVGSPGQLASFGDLHWGIDWSMPLIATLAEGVGKEFAPLLAGPLEKAYNADRVKRLADALVLLPTDDAFRLLLTRAGDKPVRPLVLDAMRRYPVRALRLLGEAARGDAEYAALAGQLLTGHVRSHPEVVDAVLADLPPEAAAQVEAARGGDRVADAPVTALPPLLVTPPWTGQRSVRKPRVATRIPDAPAAEAVWLDGEREEWAAYSSWRERQGWDQELDVLRAAGTLKYVSYAQLFVDLPEDTVRPLLATARADDYWDGEDALQPVAAKWGVAAVPLLVHGARRRPTFLSPLLLPFRDVAVAGVFADWLARLNKAEATARAWLTRHALDAVPFLVPHAVGPQGPVRVGAEKALRLLAEAHGNDPVLAAAAGCGEEAAGIVADLLAVDLLESALPTKMPEVGDWAAPGMLPQILLTEGGALPAGAVRHVLTVLAMCRPGDTYPGLTILREHCTADSLTAFAWELFEQWRLAGMPAKDSWALHALGLLGDDETVRQLTPVIRAWPGESAHHRAVEGLGVLAEIGTEQALLHLHGIAQRVPFKALKLRAQEKIAEVAAELGLTGEQLGDRLVPDFGLDADGSTVVDYGPRQFTVGFDEQLKPYIRDDTGKIRKALPAPGVKDDPQLAPAERKRFAALKKDVRTISSDLVRRLEAAMVSGRSWTAAEFRELFVSHPLVWHLVRRLVWLRDAGGETVAFRVAEDRTFADVDDDELTLPDDATVRLPHPLRLAGQLEAWSEVFADYEILQPFPQLGRAVHAFTEEEAAGHRLTRFEGAVVPVGKLLGLTKRGWERGNPEDNGVERWFSRPIDDGHHLVIGLDHGIAVGMVGDWEDQTFEYVWLGERPRDYWRRDDHPLRFGDLDPVVASEILADLTEVTAK